MGLFDSISSIASGAIGSAVDIWQSDRQAKQNEKAASTARSFSESMSDTAHQREMADLKAVGLNPVLAVDGGGASTPTAAVGGAGSGSSVGTRAVSTAFEAQQVKNQADLLKQQIQESRSRAANTDADTANKAATRPILDNQAVSSAFEAQKAWADSQSAIRDLALKDILVRSKGNEDDWEKRFPNLFSFLRKAIPAINSAASAGRDAAIILK